MAADAVNDDANHAASRREEVLRTLKDATEPLSIAQIAAQLAVHPNTVRFHLDKLVQSGRVERGHAQRRSPGRPALLFRAVRGMDPAGPRHYRLLAEALVEAVAGGPTDAPDEPRTRAVEAGRAWGRRSASRTEDTPTQDPMERLMALLDELGFAPERSEDGDRSRIGLRHCPFLELAESGSPVVCGIHLGLMRGALETWRSPVTVDRLEAFAEPDLCLAHTTPNRP